MSGKRFPFTVRNNDNQSSTKSLLQFIIPFIPADCDMPSNIVATNKDELFLYFKQMYTMRRMEITNDTEYKVTLEFFAMNE